MNQIDLKNCKAVITGGAQGIGLAIAERLLDSGASVSLWDRDEYLLKETSDALSSKGTVCLLYTSPSPRDGLLSRMPSSA